MNYLSKKGTFVLLLFLLSAVTVIGQQAPTIRGKVLGPGKSPMADVNVTAKKGGQGTITDANGNFSVAISQFPETLVFTYVGYKTTEKLVEKATTNVTISMELADNELEGAVVVSTGYQTLPKERATGAFGTVSKEQLDKPATNIASRLIGTNAGVQTLRMDEEGNPVFQIRGLSTLYANQEPLVVVDGFPIQGSYNTVNPNDVESVTILKDAAAASIWGARAVNGVIVITTKKARKGQPLKVEGSAFVRIGGKIDLGYSNPLASSAETVDFEKLSFNKWTSQFNTSVLASHYLWNWAPGQVLMNEHNLGYISLAQRDMGLDSLKNLNNQNQIEDLLLANPVTQQYNLSLSSATEKMINVGSFMYETNQSNFVGTRNQRFLFNYRTVANLAKWLDISVNTMLQHNNYFNNGSSLAEIQSLAPYEMLQDANGNYTQTSLKYYNPLVNRAIPTSLFPYTDWNYNPVREINCKNLKTSDLNLRVQAGLTIKPVKGVSFESRIQYENFNTNVRNLYGEESFTTRKLVNESAFWNPGLSNAMTTRPIPNIPKGGLLDQSRTNLISYNWRNLLSVNRQFGDDHEVNFVAGTEIQSAVLQSFNYARTYGYNDNTLQLGTLPNGPGGVAAGPGQNGTGAATNLTIRNFLNQTITIPYTNSFGYTTDRFFSAFGNLAYTYQGKYTLSGSVRTDASNLITDDPKYRYNPFWSVGGSWAISREKFMSGIKFIDQLNIRGTFGYNGNVDRSTSFIPLISLPATPDALTNQQTAFFSSLGNPKLRWEKTSTTNIGVDFSLFRRKLFGKIDFYSRKGIDLLATISIPTVNGASTQRINNADMQNYGIELELGTVQQITKDLRWSGNVNFSFNKNKITRLFLANYNALNLVARSTASYVEGYNANTLFMFTYGGLNSANLPTYVGPDKVKYDLNSAPIGDGRTYLENTGTMVAPYTLGFMNNFQYKSLSLSFIITGNLGHVFQRRGFNYPYQWTIARVQPNKYLNEVMTADASQMLTLPTNPAEPRYFFWDRYHTNFSYLAESASWVRLQEVNLSYSLPKKMLGRIGFNTAQCYVQGNDLFVLTANKFNEDPLYPLGTLNPRPKVTVGVKFDF